MKIKKRIYENVAIKMIDNDLSTLVQEKVVFDDLVVKLHSDEMNTYFALLEHKEVEAEDEEDAMKDEIGFEKNFNFGGKADSVFDSLKEKTELKLSASLLIEREGIVYHLCEDFIEIDSNELVEHLKLKKSFKTNELTSNKFEIKKINKEEALGKFNNVSITDVLEKSKKSINLSEIFNNRDYFQITALELSEENEYIIELAHSQRLRYEDENRLSELSFHDVFSTVTSHYVEENDYERFVDRFELIQ